MLKFTRTNHIYICLYLLLVPIPECDHHQRGAKRANRWWPGLWLRRGRRRWEQARAGRKSASTWRPWRQRRGCSSVPSWDETAAQSTRAGCRTESNPTTKGTPKAVCPFLNGKKTERRGKTATADSTRDGLPNGSDLLTEAVFTVAGEAEGLPRATAATAISKIPVVPYFFPSWYAFCWRNWFLVSSEHLVRHRRYGLPVGRSCPLFRLRYRMLPKLAPQCRPCSKGLFQQAAHQHLRVLSRRRQTRPDVRHADATPKPATWIATRPLTSHEYQNWRQRPRGKLFRCKWFHSPTQHSG